MNASAADDGRYAREYREPASTRLTKGVVRLLVLFVVLILAIGVFTYARSAGWLTPLGIESQSHDTQVVYAIQRTEEISLLSLGIQGIREQDANRQFFGHTIPGTSRAAFLQYNFRAKLGLDGSKVQITKTGEHAYRLSVPGFSFIGYDDLSFKTATESNGLLSFTTPDIDKSEVVTAILDSTAKQKYLTSNRDLLESQTENFYNGLIKGIDPTAQVTYSFAS